jgi:hypothetical protein
MTSCLVLLGLAMAQVEETIREAGIEVIERAGRVGGNGAVGADTAERSQLRALLSRVGLAQGLFKGARVRPRLSG